MPRPKRPWFRMYVEVIWDRKIRKLSLPARWLWVVVLACARDSNIPGVLMLSEGEPMGHDDLADASAMTIKDVEKGVDELLQRGLIEFDRNNERFLIPRWNERQYESDTSTVRTTKHRSNDVPGNGNVAPPENRDREQKKEPPISPASGGPENVPSRANGTSPRQVAARDKIIALTSSLDLCGDCSEGFTCSRHSHIRREIKALEKTATAR